MSAKTSPGGCVYILHSRTSNHRPLQTWTVLCPVRCIRNPALSNSSFNAEDLMPSSHPTHQAPSGASPSRLSALCSADHDASYSPPSQRPQQSAVQPAAPEPSLYPTIPVRHERQQTTEQTHHKKQIDTKEEKKKGNSPETPALLECPADPSSAPPP